ncbi:MULTISPECIES: dTDP-4-dehydrorhamnose reductase [unclassified Pedobacter]|uniref:dTDP-4-dehydrorhamnose reductase n=1 Tax=unclassified Pedobacter TaxID=2628915 RepID=UPI00141DCF76|nr:MULTISPECIES: dTDP-4-dehydrorhamnose reductase [unclassified Pedobacter]NII84051.1 dTDP-4-dehydrorhamnose reductase [Pedobacter sp. SG908]NMN39033.1 dTDP-4-dehydrorhamnose reductase [Pedobacter sp. SG918]
MSKILVIGAGGQLGQCLKTVAERRGINDIVFPAEQDANILDESGLNDLLAAAQPAFVINCAAYTAVDKAEDEVELAKAINETGAGYLASACLANGATLIHVSTDFVFEGNKVKLLKEDDEAKPINVYGVTKLDGELAVTAVLPAHFIMRTSWLYSEYANNFVKTMLKLGAERDELNIIADQVGTPTYAIDLANAIFDIISSSSAAYGVYHYSNEGVTSWFDFATAIFDISKTAVKVNPIPGSAYPTKATRPAFSVMDKTKIKETFNIQIPYWRDSLVECIKQIKIQ